MKNSVKFKAASFLFNKAPAVYKPLYYSFKKKQDANEIKLMHQFIKEGDIVIDIGANIGFYAEQFSDWVGPNGKVHCFEPDPDNFAMLKKHTANVSNTIINQQAISNKAGELTLYKSHRLNVDHRTYEPQEYDSSFKVKTVSIDNYINNAYSVSFIKMDIQGAEYPALLGMENTLRNPDITLMTEFWPFGLEKAGSSATQMLSFLQQLNFKIYLISGEDLSVISDEKDLNRLSNEEEEYYNILVSRKTI